MVARHNATGYIELSLLAVSAIADDDAAAIPLTVEQAADPPQYTDSELTRSQSVEGARAQSRRSPLTSYHAGVSSPYWEQ